MKNCRPRDAGANSAAKAALRAQRKNGTIQMSDIFTI